MGMYDTFEMDQNLEEKGVWLDYGDFRVRVAHAGQGNKNYVKYAEKKLKPIRKSLQFDSLANERAQAIMKDIYVTTVILDWETKVDDEMVKGIEGRDGDVIAFNADNVLATLNALPALWLDIQEQANSIANFRKAEMEADTKN